MATARTWRHPHELRGPYAARPDDVRELNQVFSDAFTERYRRDGMVGVRVPFLNPAIWRYAIDDAEDGAMLWRDERGAVAAFNVTHASGVEGWMGPLAVRPDCQGMGIGKSVVLAGVDWLRRRRASVIGLETMPRTMDNIGFYGGLGFVPGRLTLTLTLDASPAERAPRLLGRMASRDKDDELEGCRSLTASLLPGYDFSRELTLTDQLALGDTVLLDGPRNELSGFALCHTVPLVEGRVREELRVLKMVLADEESLPAMARLLCDFARRSGTRRVAFRLQGEYAGAYRKLIGMGARVRWSDLRMTFDGHAEARPARGVVLSNWEI
ncbi:MAG TPA: GNAT family N-acetyltransferase [Gemmatimonadaceae bacterium]|nr:GNAT family N-acetyltransferase [Gemmatimonadaceae bacterium]